jgi:hypothetical protein
VTEQLEPRQLPGGTATRCDGCASPIVWAITVAGPNGRGGKLMPLDPIEVLDGNVAVTNPHRGKLLARVLARDESVSRPVEYAAVAHFATCPMRAHPSLPQDVIDLQEQRRKRKGRRR